MSLYAPYCDVLDGPAGALQDESVGDLGRGQALRATDELKGETDQEMIEAFTAQGADEPFRDCVRSRCPHWGADDADVRAGEDRVEGGSELAVPVADQKPNHAA